MQTPTQEAASKNNNIYIYIYIIYKGRVVVDRQVVGTQAGGEGTGR